MLAAGGMQLPAKLLLLWRQRLGVAAVIGMLDATAPFRAVLHDLVGTGKRALPLAQQFVALNPVLTGDRVGAHL